MASKHNQGQPHVSLASGKTADARGPEVKPASAPGTSGSAQAAEERAATRSLSREQIRALHAYKCIRCVKKLQPHDQKSYKIVINDLGSHILRSGLVAAIAGVQRVGEHGGSLVLEHLACATIPGLEQVSAKDLPKRIRQLPVDDYILATRETLRVVTWLKRAAQATFGED